ncbi:hypothetical protein L6452_27581 [Arctium lappa]|uniref:Uncharacterized protein n=1 Tax=Arctium lappa TaxID=4217 RepID=A0ACB8ZWS3_ARCLA|nr:hypothetical protein L6452_27581 [Arctium lappa]
MADVTNGSYVIKNEYQVFVTFVTDNFSGFQSLVKSYVEATKTALSTLASKIDSLATEVKSNSTKLIELQGNASQSTTPLIPSILQTTLNSLSLSFSLSIDLKVVKDIAEALRKSTSVTTSPALTTKDPQRELVKVQQITTNQIQALRPTDYITHEKITDIGQKVIEDITGFIRAITAANASYVKDFKASVGMFRFKSEAEVAYLQGICDDIYDKLEMARRNLPRTKKPPTTCQAEGTQ